MAELTGNKAIEDAAIKGGCRAGASGWPAGRGHSSRVRVGVFGSPHTNSPLTSVTGFCHHEATTVQVDLHDLQGSGLALPETGVCQALNERISSEWEVE